MDELKKLEEQKRIVTAEIEQGGRDLEAINNKIAENQKKTFDVQALNEAIASLTPIKTNLEAMIKDLQEQLTGLEGEILIKTAAIDGKAKAEKEFAEVTGELNTAKSTNADLQKKNEALTIANAELEQKIIVNNSKIAEQEKKYVDDGAILEANFNTRKTEITAELTKIQSENTTLIDENTTLEQSIKDKKDEIAPLDTQASDLRIKIDGLDAEYAEKKSAKEQEIVAIGADVDVREKAVTTREGNASLMDQKLESKRNALIAVKSRLEKEQGKSIGIEI